jgi:hypothetical protein
VSIYKLNEEDFDSDDAYSEDADDDSCSVCSSDSEGSVDSFAAQARFDSEYDVDSRARRLRHRRLRGPPGHQRVPGVRRRGHQDRWTGQRLFLLPRRGR